MTAILAVSCDGTTRPGITTGRCRGWLPTPMTGDLDATRTAVTAAGWTLGPDTDLCPGCTQATR